MSGVIRWEEPPAEHGNARVKKRSKFQDMVDALRANPGQWAVVMEGKPPGSAGNLAWRIRSGVGPFAPTKAFEAKCVGPAGGSSSKVYARYIGEPEITEAWSDAYAPGGYVCAVPMPERPDGICGMPVESEPCSEHNAEAVSS